MIGRELGIDFVVGASKIQGCVTVVVGRQFLFDDVCANGDTEVVGLSGEVRGFVIVDVIGRKCGVAQIAPQHGK